MSLSYHKDIHNSIKFCLESESDIGTVHGIGALIIKEIFGISDDEIVENLMLVLKELLGSKRYKDGRAGGSKPPLDAHPVHRSPPPLLLLIVQPPQGAVVFHTVGCFLSVQRHFVVVLIQLGSELSRN